MGALATFTKVRMERVWRERQDLSRDRGRDKERDRVGPDRNRSRDKDKNNLKNRDIEDGRTEFVSKNLKET